MIIYLIVFLISAFIVFYAMIGYPLILKFLNNLLKPKEIKSDYSLTPSVLFIIPAYNEEKVIVKKLRNVLEFDYPSELLTVVVSSDCSTDSTNDLVKQFIKEHPNKNIYLYCAKNHMGKVNATNEARAAFNADIVVVTDANSYLEKNAIKELVSYYTDPQIVYVCGQLKYSNTNVSGTSDSESTYWKLELQMRNIESKFQTITAGNGALFSCRYDEYVDFDPIRSHDSMMPYYYAMHGKRCVYNPKAIAIEKAGEDNQDEFKRKVRMNRDIFYWIANGIPTLNIIKLKWFSFFYFGHRTCRYLLWLMHLCAFVSTIAMGIKGSIFGMIASCIQVIGIIITLLQMKTSVNNKYIRIIGYYGMTILAQYVGIYKILTGQTKPVWEKAETTR